jgi:hypothetical protein
MALQGKTGSIRTDIYDTLGQTLYHEEILPLGETCYHKKI